MATKHATRSATRNATRSNPPQGRGRPPKKADYSGLIFVGALVIAGVIAGPRLYEIFKSAADEQSAAVRAAKKPSVDHVEFTVVPSGGDASTMPGTPNDVREAAAVPPVRSIEPSGPVEPSTQFIAALARADASFKAADFAAAAEAYKEAIQFPAPAAKIEQARRGAEATQTFAELLQGIETSVVASAAGLHIVELKNGGKFQAKVTSRTTSEIEYVRDNGMSGALSTDLIAKLTPVSQEERDNQMRRQLKELEIKTDPQDSLGQYLLAVEAIRNGFRTDAAGYLHAAWKLDPALRSTVREHWARKLLKQGVWFHSLGMPDRATGRFDQLFKTYPDTRAAATAQEILAEAEREKMLALAAAKAEAERRLAEAEARRREAEARRQQVVQVVADVEETVVPPKTGGVTGKDAASIAAGNAAFDRGMSLVKNGLNANSVRIQNDCYHQAQGEFQKAIDLYQKALKSDPDNEALKEQLSRAGQQLYWAKKMSRL